MKVRSALLVMVLSAPLFACGNAALSAAKQGDDARLKSEIQTQHAKGKLSNDDAARLARAVAQREIAKAKDEKTALARLHDTRACALELDDALEERMKTRDGAGAEAALTRLEDGKLSESTARDWLDDADDRWRAVGTRTLHRDRDDDRAKRLAAIISPNAQIRRSAIRASADAKEPGDIDLLFETARVDPDLMLRNEALRAISSILRTKEDWTKAKASELALRFRDLWNGGDDAIKEDVAVAWALSPVFENGGREALRVAIAEGKGPGAIAAAGVVGRMPVREKDKDKGVDADLSASANALLARTILDGSRRDRLHALATAKLDGPTLESTRKAAKDDDKDIKIPALARLAETKNDGAAAKNELVDLARTEVRARHALASVGDTRVQAWIEEDLAASDPYRKTQAASALAALGRSARAAPLLVDADPSVRSRAACTMMVASRH